ncbi:MAG: hypothetical protein ACOZQL_08380 [Myxococcota bacterium]
MSPLVSKQHRPPQPGSTVSPARQALVGRLGSGVPTARLEEAARPFSNAQLARLLRAGVRLETAPRDQLHGARARYLPERHVVQVGPNATLDDLRHELAHAWDDVRNDHGRAGRSPTDRFHSQVDRRFTDAFETYRRGTARGRGLATAGQSESEAATAPWEFYATGFAMFHSSDPALRERLRSTSPQLFALISRDAMP